MNELRGNPTLDEIQSQFESQKMATDVMKINPKQYSSQLGIKVTDKLVNDQ